SCPARRARHGSPRATFDRFHCEAPHNPRGPRKQTKLTPNGASWTSLACGGRASRALRPRRGRSTSCQAKSDATRSKTLFLRRRMASGAVEDDGAEGGGDVEVGFLRARRAPGEVEARCLAFHPVEGKREARAVAEGSEDLRGAEGSLDRDGALRSVDLRFDL